MKKLFLGVFLLPLVVIASSAYDRSEWKHWSDFDKDCQDSRQETLIAQSMVEPTMDERGCRVVLGAWFDPYTGNTYLNPRELDVDHIIPLGEAAVSGGNEWTPDMKEMFANDPENLIAVSASANRSKGARDPAEWMPTNACYHQTYIRRWVHIKTKYLLAIDRAEQAAIIRYMAAAPYCQ